VPGLAAAGAAAAFALWQAKVAHFVIPGALGEIARAAFAAIALWVVCGLVPARFLLPERAAAYAPLFVLPFGLIASALELSLLGLAHVPFRPALVGVIVANAVAILLTRAWTILRRPSAERGTARTRLLWPLYLAALIAAIALLPVIRAGYATIVGQNGDVVLAAGSAELVRHAPPTAIRADLPVDRIPLVWRSKYPIFYELAAVAELSGLSTIQAFPTLAAALLAVAAFGFLLFAHLALGASRAAALGAMALVGVDRIAVHVAIHPYYNQLWATVALPFMLLTLWWFVREPSRRALGLAALWLVAGLFAYPLILPFPLFFALVAGWWTARERRAAGEPLGWWSALALPQRALPPWAPWVAAVLALALAATLVRGVVEKAVSAVVALAPGGDLSAWSGPALGYIPLGKVLGVPDLGSAVLTTAAVAALLALAAYGIWRLPRAAAVPFGALCAAGLLAAAYLRARHQTELFYFKTVGFTGPLVVTAAALGIADLLSRGFANGRDAATAPLARRGAAVLGAVALAGVFTASAVDARREISVTYEYVTRDVLLLRDWSKALPPNASVRLDIPPNGWQLWAQYMLADRPLCSTKPFAGFFPSPPVGVRADYVLVYRGQPRPYGAEGTGPVQRSEQFRLWKLRPGLPGAYVCSRRMVDAVTHVAVG
jgi:hypothetical protein